MELDKTYQPEPTERPWYPLWEERGYLKPRADGKTAYSIVIPPPNVTGSLHMGHALNATLQDILIRMHRMQGDRTVWVPGTDHGGIATQNVVEKLLRSENTSGRKLGRPKFLERMWEWRRQSGDTILMQLRRLGASCDWSRTRFTMDEQCSKAVRHAFVTLFNKDLIYRGPRMVNWCPQDRTALSDIEVEHEHRSGKLWHIRYPLSDGSGSIVVATTRPETMLGDTAVAVNPTDERYQSLIGKTLKLPLTTREIPIIDDVAVESAFGTGAVKVTPAHDPTDFEIGERHDLKHEIVIDFDGKMTAKAGAYAGMDRFDARKKIVEDLEALGQLEKTEDYKLSVSVCYRCNTVIEPLVSDQWFMKMAGVAKSAADATRDGRVKIFPASWEKPYLLWLDNIRDWCISRQIWWGHQIPVWNCLNIKAEHPTCKLFERPITVNGQTVIKKFNSFASVENPSNCRDCGSEDITQDDDVLDTWFSSALWPLEVFGWPQNTADLQTFYPTNVLVTGHEILYLWVARMVMMGLEFTDKVPFHHVYIHGIVRDKQGKKMSKSIGNVIDPLEKMAQFGTDALRFSLAESSIPGRDLHLSDDSFMKARNFANKIWNASRFVLMNMEGYSAEALPPSEKLGLADKWILHELQETIARTTQALGSYNPSEAARTLYEFVWGSLCDWYLEISKVALMGTEAAPRGIKQNLLVHLLTPAMALLHPIMPYETEALYQAFKPFLENPSESLMIASWPTANPKISDAASAAKMNLVKDVVTSIRTLRSESVVPPSLKIDCDLRGLTPAAREILHDADVRAFIISLARLNRLDIAGDALPDEFLFSVFGGGEIYITATGLVDKEKEKARIAKELQKLEATLSRGQGMLGNNDFIQRAPAEEVARIRALIAENQQKINQLRRTLEGLS